MNSEEREHLWNEYERIIPEIIAEFGVCNATSGLSNAVDEFEKEGGMVDIKLARAILEAACIGTDLCYDDFECSSGVVRDNALHNMKLWLENEVSNS